MINLLIGPPGGGKSYEAVVYHVLPALQRGRKVITNLPLDLERLAALDPSFPGLVQFVENRRGIIPIDPRTRGLLSRFAKNPVEPQEGIIRAFSTIEDYADPWRHPETGSGPFYVIDECHMCLPRGGTAIEVEEWFSLHRHESADALLITQSYGKVSKDIIDLVQMCYRVKKATAFGSQKKYIRKVQDGVRGEVVNTSVREYQKRYFGLYKSHTRGGGQELEAQDITPIWKRWPFLGAAVFLPAACSIFAFGGSPNPMTAGSSIAHAEKVVANSPGRVQAEGEPERPAEKKIETGDHPYAGRALHLYGSLESKRGILYVFAVSQNGQKIHEVTGGDLQSLGYTIEPGTSCAARISHGKWSQWVICDAPQVGVVGASAPPPAVVQDG